MNTIYGFPHVRFLLEEDRNRISLLRMSRKLIVEEVKNVLSLDFLPTILHRDNGSPFIKEIIGTNISISHTRGAVAFILDNDSCVGIDIEIITQRAVRLLDRFTEEKERNIIADKSDPFYSTLFFSAKETSYKLMNSCAETITDFCVTNIDAEKKEIYLRYLDMEIVKVNYEKIGDYVVTWAVSRHNLTQQ